VRIGISGHRDLTDETVIAVRREIQTRLAGEDSSTLVGVSCLADGADQIFAQAVLGAGGRLSVVIPSTDYRDRLPETAHATYDDLISHADDTEALDYTDSTPDAHMAASRAMLDQIGCLFAVWDGKPARSWGGTADVVDEARQREIDVVVIWPEGSRRLG
jgi:hypothetical protein